MIIESVQTPINKEDFAPKSLIFVKKSLKIASFWLFFKKIFDFVCKISELYLYLHQKCNSVREIQCPDVGFRELFGAGFERNKRSINNLIFLLI
jgi:hypothetical protein